MIGVALAMLATRNTRPQPSSETPTHLGRAPYGKSRGISAQDFQDEFRALVERILLILEEDGDFPRASVDAQLKQIAHRFASENISDALRLQAALARELMDAIRAQVDFGNSLE